jgi:hypothetical protein
VAKITELTFGSIVIERNQYHRGVLISVDGTANKRKDGLLMLGANEIDG